MKLNIIYKKFRFIYLIMLVVILFSGTALKAESWYPSPTDDYVNDYANILNKPDAEKIHKMFKRLEHQSGIKAIVVTINSFRDYNTGDTTLESFATNLFNTWGIGHKKENNGVLILVALGDRKCCIELGAGYGGRYDSAMQQIIEINMISYFKVNEYSKGIYESSRAVIEKVTKEVSGFSFYRWHILIVILIGFCVFAGISCMRSGKKGWGWAFFIAAGMLLFFLIRILARVISFRGGSSFGGGASGRW